MNGFNSAQTSAPTSAPYPNVERPSQYVIIQGNSNVSPESSVASPTSQGERPYPMAPYPTYTSMHSNASTESITTRLNNVQLQQRKTSVAQNPNAMGSSLSFQSSLDAENPRQTSVSSTHQSAQKVPSNTELSPLEQTHQQFMIQRDQAIRDQSFTPSIQLKYVKLLLQTCSDDAFLLRYDVTGAEWGHMLSSSDLKKNQHTFIKQAIKLLKKLANDVKDSESQFILASLYSHAPTIKVPKRDILERNYEKARDLYAKAGSRGHDMALYRLAVSYELGVGGSADEAKALDCFEKSAQQNCIPAMFRLGMIYSRGNTKAVRSAQRSMFWLLKAAGGASKENPHALFELGKVFERDISLGNSPSDAAYLRDLDTLGYRYDEAKALFYYKEAARFTYAPAQFKLGWCYEYGKLQCPIDAKKSIGWYSRAAKQGHSAAEMALSGWYLTGAKGVLVANDREAFLWATKAAQAGFAKAEYALGYYYEVGLGCDKDGEMAKKYYLRAATQGHEKSIKRLKLMRDKGM